jgi:peroxiredoxin
MDSLLLACRLLVAAVFLFAGAAKIADAQGSRRAVAGFGLGGPFVSAVAIALPLAELGTAVALVPEPSAWWGSVAALALLVAFGAAITVNLLRGRTPECHCFGTLSSEPIGWSTLVRNALLAAPAAVVAGRGPDASGTSAVAWIGDLSTAERAALVIAGCAFALAALEAYLLLQLLAQNGRVLLRLDAMQERLDAVRSAAPVPEDGATSGAGLAVGEPAPEFSLTGVHGETMTLAALRSSGKPVLLSFTSPSCRPCTALLPDLARWQRELAGSVTVAFLSQGTAEANREKAAEHSLSHVLLQREREVSDAYLAYGTPSAVLVRPDGMIGSGLAQGAEAIRALVARVAGGAATPMPLAPYPPPPGAGAPCPNCGQYHGAAPSAAPAAPAGLAVGTPAPALKLRDLTGREVDLADYRGRETLVLFWNPGCGFCQQLMPQLKAWESDHPSTAPALLVVSTGEVAANEAMGFASTVVLDQGFAVGGRFAANGTPSGVLIDAAGNVSSTLAVGGPAVMELAKGR